MYRPNTGPVHFPPVYRVRRPHHTTNFCVSLSLPATVLSSLLLSLKPERRAPLSLHLRLRLLSPSTLQPTTALRPGLALAVLSPHPRPPRVAPCSSLPQTVAESRRSFPSRLDSLSLSAGGASVSRPRGRRAPRGRSPGEAPPSRRAWSRRFVRLPCSL